MLPRHPPPPSPLPYFFSPFDCKLQVLALLRCRMPSLPKNCSVHEGAAVAAADVACWRKFVLHHRAVGLAMLSAAQPREAAHHFSTAAVALASAVSLSKHVEWEESRELALLMAACSALVPHLPLEADRLMRFVNRLGVSPSQPLPPLRCRLCEAVQSSPKSLQQPLFSPFVAASAAHGWGGQEGEWTAFIESAGLDAAVTLLTSASGGSARSSRVARLYRMQRLVAWMRDNGIVMPIVL